MVESVTTFNEQTMKMKILDVNFHPIFFRTVASISPGLPFFSRQQFLQEVNNDVGDGTTVMVMVVVMVIVVVNHNS